jgi:hypothetical protein
MGRKQTPSTLTFEPDGLIRPLHPDNNIFSDTALSCDCVRGRTMNLVRQVGVQLEIFRFINVAMNFHTHRRLLVIEGWTGYLGGTGIANHWKGDAVEMIDQVDLTKVSKQYGCP